MFVVLWRSPSLIINYSLWDPLEKSVVGGVAAPDLAESSSSIVIEIDYSGIFHCGEGRQGRRAICSILDNNFLYLRLAISFDLSKVTLYYFCSIIFVYLLLLQNYLFRLTIHQESNYVPQFLFKRNYEGKFSALHQVYDIISW